MMSSQKLGKWLTLACLIFLLPGCVGGLRAIPESFPEHGSVAFGHITVVLGGTSHRWYEPEVQFIEVYNATIDKRFRVDIESDDSLFAVPLPEGDYHLTRVQIGEGGFRGMAELTASFHLDSDVVNYLGRWTLTVGSPFYDRDLMLTVSSEMVKAVAQVHMFYPNVSPRVITTNLAEPPETQARLFEVTPYPRMRWFQRRPTG